MRAIAGGWSGVLSLSVVGQPETDDRGRISSGRKNERFPVWVLMGSEGALATGDGLTWNQHWSLDCKES